MRPASQPAASALLFANSFRSGSGAILLYQLGLVGSVEWARLSSSCSGSIFKCIWSCRCCQPAKF